MDNEEALCGAQHPAIRRHVLQLSEICLRHLDTACDLIRRGVSQPSEKVSLYTSHRSLHAS